MDQIFGPHEAPKKGTETIRIALRLEHLARLGEGKSLFYQAGDINIEVILKDAPPNRPRAK